MMITRRDGFFAVPAVLLVGLSVFLLGRDAGIIEKCARDHGFTDIHTCRDMPECVRRAAELAEPGDRVLLSPACASWDMYDNFEQRGKHFKECLKEMLR